MKSQISEYYDKLALEYCEKYGIIGGKLQGSKFIYYANYPKYLEINRYTMKVTVNLKTMEETRQRLKRWNKQGDCNRYK